MNKAPAPHIYLRESCERDIPYGVVSAHSIVAARAAWAYSWNTQGRTYLDLVVGERTRRPGIMLIVGGAQAGLGRMGKMFAFQHAGMEPDLVTRAKRLAAGLHIGQISAALPGQRTFA